MGLSYVSKKLRRNYVNEMVEKGDYLVAKYADGNSELLPNNEIEKNKIKSKNEKAITNCGIKKRLLGYLTIALLAASIVATISLIALSPIVIASGIGIGNSLLAVFAISLSTLGCGFIIDEFGSIKKGKYFVENKEIINNGIEKELKKGYKLDRNNPYNGLTKVVEKTGETKLDIMNVMNSTISLKELKKMKRAALEMKQLEYLEQKRKQTADQVQSPVMGISKVKKLSEIIH
jgi:hypothetical protein